MLMWSKEIEQRVEGEVGEIPAIEKAKWLLPKREHLKPDWMAWVFVVSTPLIVAFGSPRNVVIHLGAMALLQAFALIVLAWNRDLGERQRGLIDEQQAVIRRQHDQLLAGRYAKLYHEIKHAPFDAGMN